jgi:predicted GH43/DUF377 family glycosyl hydrolase
MTRIGFFIFCSAVFLIACNSGGEVEYKGETSWQLIPFTRVDSVNPILVPDTSSVFFDPILQSQVRWEEKDVFNPAAVIRNDTVFLLYRAQDKIGKFAGTSRIGLAWSTDGLHFKKNRVPVLYPQEDEQKKWEWEGGCEDPRIVLDESGKYYLLYTAYDGKEARLMVAVSDDLVHWLKQGHAFEKAYDGRYIDAWTKSASVVATYVNGNPVAVKINGKYWMYWGDTNIFLASSPDLINWTPVEEKDSVLKIVFGPRKGKFDSDLVEPKGILLLYNSRNVPSKGDSSLLEGTYAAGQILLEKDHPGNVIDRAKNYFIVPEKDYETQGQVNQVCFVEGLIQFKGKWLLYYGTADSKIAVAMR